MQSKRCFNSKCSSNPRMNSLLYRSTCNNSGIESAADTCWSLQNHQRSCRSTTELMFDSSNDIWNMSSRSVKGDTFCSSRFVFNFVLFLCLSSRVVPGFVVCKSISNNVTPLLVFQHFLSYSVLYRMLLPIAAVVFIRDMAGSSVLMFNGPCQLHGGRGSSSAAVAAAMVADENLLTPDGFDPFPHGRSFQPLQELIAPPAVPCSADHCLMNPEMTCPDVYEAMQGIQFMAEHTRREQYTIRVNFNLNCIYPPPVLLPPFFCCQYLSD